jgi:hypothetical protein
MYIESRSPGIGSRGNVGVVIELNTAIFFLYLQN